jgi:hypothetical protein
MPPSRTVGQAWYSSLTIDVFIKILNNSIFHPFVASLIPLCLRAGEVPYSAPVFRNTVYWAILMCVISILLPFNERLAYGKPRKIDHEEEVIVITGGSSGLGNCLAELYAMKGASVAVLDIKLVGDGQAVEGVKYYTCDIGDEASVARAWAEIVKEFGDPTVLINNAGVVHGKRSWELSTREVER